MIRIVRDETRGGFESPAPNSRPRPWISRSLSKLERLGIIVYELWRRQRCNIDVDTAWLDTFRGEMKFWRCYGEYRDQTSFLVAEQRRGDNSESRKRFARWTSTLASHWKQTCCCWYHARIKNQRRCHDSRLPDGRMQPRELHTACISIARANSWHGMKLNKK